MCGTALKKWGSSQRTISRDTITIYLRPTMCQAGYQALPICYFIQSSQHPPGIFHENFMDMETELTEVKYYIPEPEL